MKRSQKQWLTLLLVAVLAAIPLLALAGCNNTKNPDQPKVPQITLAENGLTDYTIVRSDYETSKSVVTQAAVRLRDAINTATNSKMEIATDYVKRGDSAPTDTLEILVGDTNRQESTTAKERLGENEYIITMIGKRLVIIGSDEEGTSKAVDEFITRILGYDSATGTYAVQELKMDENYELLNSFTPSTPSTPTDPSTTIFGEQNKPTKSPATYLKPTYRWEDGLYVQSYPSFTLQGVRTTFQTNTLFSELYGIHSDSVMVYSTADANFADWYKPGNYVVDMMIAINRADSSYLSLSSSHYDDIQMNSAGKYLEHSTGGSYYMVPTEAWIDYVWEKMLKPIIEHNHPQTIALEEPEMWIASGYSESFKREWLDFYGEEWEDPASSASATLKSNLLKTHLFERILTVLSQRIKEISPSTQVYIATHSTVNYSAWAIDAGLNHYVATGAIDGVIGQTWSDTHNTAFPHRGTNIQDNYTHAFVEYISYVDSVEGLNFYALADPMADNSSFTEADCQYIYRQSIAAQLMQPEIHRFQILPWVQRAFANVSGNYRTIQSQIYEMLNDVGGENVTVRAGTPGITYLISDSMSWMNPGNNFALNPTSGMYGICASLVREGIPLKMKSMDQLSKASDLDGVSLLIISYDSSVPLDEEINIAIADWVKNGGTLLCLTGSNKYWDNDDYFFWKNDGNPLSNLFGHMGLGAIRVQNLTGVPSNAKLTTEEELLSTFEIQKVGKSYRDFAISFTGSQNVILQLGNAAVGIEETVGKGHLIAIGLPSAYYASIDFGAVLVNRLTEYALQYTDYDYATADMMVVERGNYVAAHSYKADHTLKGSYIDLYDASLPVRVNPTVPRDDSFVGFCVTDMDRSIPRLGFTSGNVKDGSLHEESGKMTYTVTSAGNTVLANRILLPDGVYPQKITIQRGNKQLTILEYTYDKDTHSCMFRFDGSMTEATIEITFGKGQQDIGLGAMASTDETIVVNNKNLDEKYLISNTASASDNLRFCDNNGQLVYHFDLTEYTDPIYYFHVSQNYIVEISADNKTWTIIADYSQGGTVPRIQNGSNATVITVDPADYSLDDELYVRFRNTQTVGGFGATLSRITIRHLVPAGEVPAGDQAKGNNNTTQLKDPTLPSVDDSKYRVSTDPNTGISKYRRRVATNSRGEDEEFLEFTDAGVNNDIRYCDGARQLIYCFDVSQMLTATFRFNVFQNYILEVSSDGEDYTIVADYSQGGKIPHLTTGGNNTTITVDPFEYGCEETGFLYVRLRNTDTTQGWGGSISSFTMEYTKMG